MSEIKVPKHDESLPEITDGWLEQIDDGTLRMRCPDHPTYEGYTVAMARRIRELQRVADEMAEALKLTFEECPVENNCLECETTRAALVSYAALKGGK